MIGGYNAHIGNATIHVTAAEKEAWNGKADASALTAHTGDTTIHVTAEDKQAWNGHVADTTIHVTSADKQAWNGKADASALTAHTGDTTIHVTSADKQAWNSKADASALTAHTGNATIHVTAEDKEAWNGKADASALTAHTGDTTIHVTAEDKEAWNNHVADTVKHVTAEDKARWDAVTSKADDSDVVHKSGNETVGGKKAFSEYITSDGSSTGGEYSSNTRTNLWLMSNRDTEKVSGVLFDTYRQNTAQGTGIHILGISIKENSVRYEGCRLGWYWDNNLNGYTFDFKPTTQGANQAVKHNLGTSTDKWKTINGLNPGALSMPTGNTSDMIDISSYITLFDGTNNGYTPPADGWICISGKNCTAIYVYGNNYWGVNSFSPTADIILVAVPVVSGVTFAIKVIGQGLNYAKFVPCKGNV